MRPPPLFIMSPFRSSLAEGLAAARQNVRPAIVLLVFTTLLILGYEFWPAMHGVLNELAAIRDRTGWTFAVISTALFGGALPLVFRRFLLHRPPTFDEVVFGVTFWGYKGFEVALFYDFQAWLWGSDHEPATLVLKVLTDQFVYVPLIAVPNMTLGYLWLANGFIRRRTREQLRKRSFWSRALPVLISNASVWIPACAFIYMFPTALQLPLQNIVLIFWILILMLVTGKKERDPEEPPAATAA